MMEPSNTSVNYIPSALPYLSCTVWQSNKRRTAHLADIGKFGTLTPLQYNLHHFHLERRDVFLFHERNARLCRDFGYSPRGLLEDAEGLGEFLFQPDLCLRLPCQQTSSDSQTAQLACKQ